MSCQLLSLSTEVSTYDLLFLFFGTEDAYIFVTDRGQRFNHTFYRDGRFYLLKFIYYR